MVIHSFPANPSGFIRVRRHPAGCCLLMLAMIFVIPFMAETAFSADKRLIRTRIKVALIKSAFLGSNEEDAAAAFKVFARVLGKQKGYNMEISVSTFTDSDELSALPQYKRPHIAILGSWAFLEIEKEGWLTPVAATSIGDGQVLTSYKILVPASSTVKTIEDLRGKTMSILFMPQTQTGLPWLRSLLAQRALGTMESFFENTIIEHDPMKAILPVFFEQRDAGLITAEKFALMAELNPQLKRMRTIAVSAPLACGITAVNQKGWDTPRIKQDFIDGMLGLHLSSTGQQLLNLFKTDQIIAYQPEYMDTVREIARILSGTHP